MEKKIKQPLTMFLLLFMFLFLFAANAIVHGNANEDFKSFLANMKAYYEEGKLEEFIELYKKTCLEEGKEKEKKEFKKLNKEIRAQIYRWVYLSYTAMDMPEAAEKILGKFLVIRHHEEVDQPDLMFIKKAAREKYHVAPRFLVGLNIGTNFTMMHPVKRYMAVVPAEPGEMDAFRKDYGFHLTHCRGKSIGIVLEYVLTKHLSISMQPAVTSIKFQYKNTLKREWKGGEPVTLNYTHRHRLGYVEIPVLLIYRRITGKLKPYVQVGGYYGILTSGEKLLRWSGFPDKDYEEEAIVDIKKQFNASNTGFWLGAGLAYELSGSVRLQVELNYRHGLNNITDKARRFENKELVDSYYDVFDDMKLRNWDLSLKILLPLSYEAFKK